MTDSTAARRVPIKDLVRYYLRLGLLGFGGPVALVGQMERELVAGKGWITKGEMREGIAICQSLPGPLAVVVTFACDLGDLASRAPRIERWDDVPAVSADFKRARDVIVAKVTALLEDPAVKR